MTAWTRMVWLPVLSLVCLGAWPSGLAASEPSLEAAVDNAFRPLLATYDVPGIAVAVTVNGHPRFFNYGVADRATGTPVTENTIFEIGSVSKTFTATLAALAVAGGQMSLDQHPDAFIPALRGSAIAKATLRDLGTYTAGGLPLQVPDAVRTEAEMIAYLQHWTPEAAPGTERRYSNVSLGLFGSTTSLALKRDFADLMDDELIPQLGLRSTFVHVPASRMAAYAWGYAKDGSPVRAHPGVFDVETYGIRSTPSDMIRFIADNLRPDALATPLRQAVAATHVGYVQVGGMTQGLGWEAYPYPVRLDQLLAGNADAMIMGREAATPLPAPRLPTSPTLFDKTGSTNGFAAYAAFVPAKNIGLVMLANKNFPIAARVEAAYAVLDRLSILAAQP